MPPKIHKPHKRGRIDPRLIRKVVKEVSEKRKAAKNPPENRMVKISKFVGSEIQVSRLGRHEWSVARLFELSKDLKVMTIPLEHLNINYSFSQLSLRELVSHMKAVDDCDLDYPIILDEDGDIMDGRHRVMKALVNEDKTIKAVRFVRNPTPCKIYDS